MNVRNQEKCFKNSITSRFLGIFFYGSALAFPSSYIFFTSGGSFWGTIINIKSTEYVVVEKNLEKSTHNNDVRDSANSETDRNVESSKGNKSDDEKTDESPACVRKQLETVMHHYEESSKTNKNELKIQQEINHPKSVNKNSNDSPANVTKQLEIVFHHYE